MVLTAPAPTPKSPPPAPGTSPPAHETNAFPVPDSTPLLQSHPQTNDSTSPRGAPSPTAVTTPHTTPPTPALQLEAAAANAARTTTEGYASTSTAMAQPLAITSGSAANSTPLAQWIGIVHIPKLERDMMNIYTTDLWNRLSREEQRFAKRFFLFIVLGVSILKTTCGTPNYVALACIRTGEIKNDKWFRKEYSPVKSIEYEDVNLDDVNAVFDAQERSLLRDSLDEPVHTSPC